MVILINFIHRQGQCSKKFALILNNMLIYVLYLSSTVNINTEYIFSNVHYKFMADISYTFKNIYIYILVPWLYLAGFIYILYLQLTVSLKKKTLK